MDPLKRERRKRREAKKKARVRSAQYAAGADAGEDAAGAPDDERLFSLGDLPGGAPQPAKRRKGAGGALAGVAEAAAPNEDLLEAIEADSDDEGGGSGDESEESDEDGLAYERRLEADLERSYEEYLARRGDRAVAAREKRSRLRKRGGDLSDDEDAPAGADDVITSEDDDSGDDAYEAFTAARAEAEAAEAGRGAGLLVRLEEGRAGVAKGGKAAAAQWFGQDVFDDPNVLGPEDSDEEEEEGQQQQQQAGKGRGGAAEAGAAEGKAAAKKGKRAAAAAAEQPTVGPAFGPQQQEQQQQGAKRKRGGAAAAAAAAPAAAGGVDDGGDDGGVSSGSEEGDSDLEEFESLDDHSRAQVLALAKKMLRRKDKESVMDAAYN
ncbi:hypothetical protein MNEG_15666, partial [Monoraphidium neglectum]